MKIPNPHEVEQIQSQNANLVINPIVNLIVDNMLAGNLSGTIPINNLHLDSFIQQKIIDLFYQKGWSITIKKNCFLDSDSLDYGYDICYRPL
jgi:hypothetical protein